ncbi:DUF58 domain-containing protein [Xylanimonas allomyrinae]|uniref:DUF58 domain-containing protein n=1 Tax=Xylanimonas allomyrinae TaxID=2509459 RepID=A0A4P6EJV1_9MICO|nr:DUF58 domain-containing protein [Xylanimonas allomyrinae]QAY62655.1 DUF58 domain-containing protein [Xylanimonas allomyrinae]
MTWRPTRAAAGAAATGIAVLALGVLLARPDVALLGVPLVLAFVLGRVSRPDAPSAATFGDAGQAAQPGEIAEELRVTPAPGCDVVHVRVFAPGHRPAEVVLPGTDERALPLHLATVRTGPQRTFHADVRGLGPYGGSAEDAHGAQAPGRLVLPEASRLGRVPLPSRLRGLTGPRASRRLGDGTELRDVHPMGPGDRLRRVDWRATARRSPALDSLYVRRTFATAEAGAVLVLDSRDDVGPDPRTWRGTEPLRVDEPTSLDLARHAAASIATSLVGAGDRVGLEDLAFRRRPVPAATGKRHLRRILHALALAAPVGSPTTRVRPPQVPADAIVYLFTTLLDDAPVALVEAWAEQGVPTVVVDTLPDVQPVPERHLTLAWRITSMERADRVRALTARGVPVVRWAGSERAEAAARFEVLVRAGERHRPVAGARR